MSSARHCPQVPVSWGELLDKITILEIKRERIASAQARRNVTRELALLVQVAGDAMRSTRIAQWIERLRAVNEELWDIEDAIRAHEGAGDFGLGFVKLARAVYQKNDARAAIKRQINDLFGSALVEEKSYGQASALPRPGLAGRSRAGGHRPALPPAG